MLHLPVVLMNRLNKTAVLLYCRFSLFLKDPFLEKILRSQQLSLCCAEKVKLLPFHRYSVDIFSYIDHQEYWVLMESRILLKPVLWGVRIVVVSISSHEQAQ